MTREDILTVEEVSSILGISKNTVQRRDWRDRTGCPLRKLGKRLYILDAEFNKWVRNTKA